MKKKTIGILFGGYSPEHEVSLVSAYSVVVHIDRTRFEPVLVGISETGEWYLFSGDVQKIKDGTWNNPNDCLRAIISPDRKTQGLLIFENDTYHSIKLEAAMPVLHGKNGEDGTVQGLLALAGIPIIGCGMLSSALCMDKSKAHQLVSMAGIRVPRSFNAKSAIAAEWLYMQAEILNYPLFVKPVNAGSSFGISKVMKPFELLPAFELALRYDDEVIIEENIPGFEIGCAVFGKDELIVGVVDEIELKDGFFDFHEKYTFETSQIHVPARIEDGKAKEAKEMAKVIYRVLGCNSFARVDMFITPEGEIVFNEVNTIPGFTPYSRFPNMLKAAGMTFSEVVNGAIGLVVGDEK